MSIFQKKSSPFIFIFQEYKKIRTFIYMQIIRKSMTQDKECKKKQELHKKYVNLKSYGNDIEGVFSVK